MSKRKSRNNKNTQTDNSLKDNNVDYAESTALPSKQKTLNDPKRKQKHSSTPEEIEEIINDTYFLKLEEERPFLTRKRVVFTAGIILGIFIASFLAPQGSDFHLFSSYIAESFSDLDITSILPANILVEELFGNITLFLKPNISLLEDTEFMPGLNLAQEGLRANFPVVLVPGIVSTGLESWSTSNCSRPYFRKRMWGTTTMFRAVLMDKECWENNMKLDPVTGLDPPDIKLRAAQGLDAADYLFPGYWVWGALVILYFFKWAESPLGGNGGSSWVNNHIEAFVNIGGPLLGVPKTISSLLSGEMRDTVELGAFGIYVLERFFSRRERAELFRSWGGLSSMLPKGGEAIWGNITHAPDDHEGSKCSYGPMLTLRSLIRKKIEKNDTNVTNDCDYTETEQIYKHTTNHGIDYLRQHTGLLYNEMLSNNFSYGIITSEEEIQNKSMDHTKWTNPLESQLPYAPEMKIYCLYGWGKETERAYYYVHDHSDSDDNSDNDSNILYKFSKNIFIDSAVNSDHNLYLKSGVHNGEGDGTVPLLSLGYMCTKGWKNPLYNPAGIKVITREFEHERGPGLNIRGGAKTADHVDILGNYALTEDILRIAAGDGEKLEDRITSDILEYASKIDI
ncbi:Lecithin:cholesterol acyltransferase [Gigaspora margarita]|uniref:Lecithin:cholesterol acyltransferase n=1 Tax=Gigaspora margarita TaxID=4874 RepID=A0A8H4A2K3_GIGMA|nr:Lecithin:cholesterol acyltransferase [Gigaspora margarita]